MEISAKDVNAPKNSHLQTLVLAACEVLPGNSLLRQQPFSMCTNLPVCTK
jgi:hypothetical protein